jgi:hypothetical protein
MHEIVHNISDGNGFETVIHRYSNKLVPALCTAVYVGGLFLLEIEFSVTSKPWTATLELLHVLYQLLQLLLL